MERVGKQGYKQVTCQLDIGEFYVDFFRFWNYHLEGGSVQQREASLSIYSASLLQVIERDLRTDNKTQ